MKGNQESMLYTTNATVAALNHVSGFDPLKFLRRTTSRKTGEDVIAEPSNWCRTHNRCYRLRNLY